MSEVHKDKFIMDPKSRVIRRANEWAYMSSNFNKLGWFLISIGGASVVPNLYVYMKNRHMETSQLLTAVSVTALLVIGANVIRSAKRFKELLRTEELKENHRIELTGDDKKFLRKLKVKL